MINIISLIKVLLAVSIYSFSVQTIDGNTVSLNSFKGKKMLIVNTASGSKFANQLGSLERLRQQYPDSLVILAFPSNDFGREPGSDSAISQAANANYSIGYILCSKVSVIGPAGSPLYQWLGDGAQNGSISSPVNEDFFKYLIDENGNIRGVFAGSVDPMDSVVQNAIRTNYN
jgi:glutathione peroxidase